MSSYPRRIVTDSSIHRGNENHSFDAPLIVGPHVICVDSQGSLYVGEVAKAFGKVDRGARVIQKFARCG